MPDSAETIILIDVSGWIYAAYHRMPNLQTSDGEPTGAVYGFTQILWKLLREPPVPFTHIAGVFDYGGPTWRANLDPTYKANRDKKPNKLSWQGASVRRACALLGVTVLEAEGYEADDVIATYVRRARTAELDVVIVSGDKDFCQLVDDPHVRLFNSHPRKGTGRDTTIDPRSRWVTEHRVEQKFGVKPKQVADVQALAGDTSDGYAGVPGIGDVIAGDLVSRFGNLEGVIAEAKKGVASFIKPGPRARIIEHAERARMCKRLATLDQSAEVFTPLDELRARSPEIEGVLAFLAEHQMTEFSSRFRRELPALLEGMVVA